MGTDRLRRYHGNTYHPLFNGTGNLDGSCFSRSFPSKVDSGRMSESGIVISDRQRTFHGHFERDHGR